MGAAVVASACDESREVGQEQARSASGFGRARERQRLRADSHDRASPLDVLLRVAPVAARERQRNRKSAAGLPHAQRPLADPGKRGGLDDAKTVVPGPVSPRARRRDAVPGPRIVGAATASTAANVPNPRRLSGA